MLIRLFKRWLGLSLLFFVLPAFAITTLDQAIVTVDLAGQSSQKIAVRLPHQWDQFNPVSGGLTHFSLQFISIAGDVEQAIFIARNGNRFTLSLNGVVIAKMGVFGQKNENFANQPHMFAIPANLLRLHNTLEIITESQGVARGGLSKILIGHIDEIRDVYQAAYRWRVTGTFVTSIVSAVLGALSMLLWLRQRKSLFLWYGLSEILWALYLSDTQLLSTPFIWPWWDIIILTSFAIAPVFICKFWLEVMQLHNGILPRLVNSYIFFTLPVSMFALFEAQTWLWVSWKIMLLLICGAVGLVAVPRGLRSKVKEEKLLAYTGILMLLVGVRDVLVLTIFPRMHFFDRYADSILFWPGDIAWTRYAWLIFAIVMAWIIAERLRKASQEIASMNQTLQQQLAYREAELNTVFVQQALAGRQQAILEERQRLTRDMHDGLGGQLLSVIQQARDPAVTREVLAQQLRETMDHLKLTVDAMQDTEGDIASLLGSLRYRLGSRLESAGIQLAWSVASLPAMANWTLQQSRDLQMILFEALSNLITHAGAKHASLSAVYRKDLCQIQICLEDNGSGFNANAVEKGRGNGIFNMRMRAKRIDASLNIISASTGTKITLTVPLAAGNEAIASKPNLA